MNSFSRAIARIIETVCRFVAVMAQTTPFVKIGALTLLIYLGIWAFYDNPAMSGPRVNREVFLWPVVILLLGTYWVGYQRLKHGMEEFPLRTTIGFGMAMAFCALMTEPFHSTDMFGYINRGWEQVQYGLNPYVYPIDAIKGWKDDPMFTSHWSNNPSPYAFLFVLIAKWICTLGGGNFDFTVLLFKALNLLVYAVTGWFLYKGSEKLGFDRPDLALYLFLWNPLILVHQIANGHNDLLMGFLVVAAVHCAICGGLVWILPLLTAAVLIKYAPVILLPIAVFYLFKQRAWGALALGCILSAGLAYACALPYLPDLDQARLALIERNAFVSRGSLHALLFDSWKEIANLMPALKPYEEMARAFLKNTLLLGFVLFYAWQGLRQIKQTFDVSKFIHFCTLMLFALITVVSLKFYPWYVAIFMPVALLLPVTSPLRPMIILLSCGQMLSLTAVGQTNFLNVLMITALPLWLGWYAFKNPTLTAVCEDRSFNRVVAETL